MEVLPKFNNFRQAESIQFFNDVINVCAKPEFKETGMEQVVDNLTQVSQLLKGEYKNETASLITSVLTELDQKRDEDYMMLHRLVWAYTHHFDKQKAEAAAQLLRAIDKYGKHIHRMNYVSETNALQNVGMDLTTKEELISCVNLLQVGDIVNHLIETNDEFNHRFLERVEESADSTDIKTAEKIKEAHDLFYDLVDHLNAHLLLHPSEQLNRLGDQIEALIEKYNKIVAFRMGNSKEQTN